MRIVCPQCGYSRDIPADKVPARSAIATCPKCQFRFRFRGRDSLPAEEPAPEEPVYPPRPSRPRTDWNPGRPAPAAQSFEPSQKLYGAEPEPAPPVQPRPQARWLPDPEPAPEADPYDAPARRRPAQPEDDDFARPPFVPAREPEPDPEPWRAPAAPAPPASPARASVQARRQTFEPVPPPVQAPNGTRIWSQPPGDDGEFQAPPGHTGQDVRPPADPWDIRGNEPSQGRFVPTDDFDDAPAAPAARRAQVRVERTQNQAWANDPDAPLPEEQPQDVQPSEAVAGEDSVRDIWARLQAMGGETRPRQSGGPEQAEAPGHGHPPARHDGPAPWETLEHHGVVPAYLNTAKAILVRPGDFFDQLPPMEGVLRPLVFALVTCLVAVLAGVVWNSFGLGPNLSELGRTDGFQGLGRGPVGGLAMLGLAPIVLAGFVYLDAGLGHLLLGLLRSATRPFAETFRTLCYAGAPWLLSLLPVPYSYLIPVVLIWHMTLQAIGLKKLHHAGYPQVLAAVLVKWSLYFMASFAFLHVLITRR
ncbi:hypothetical protein NNJEOMEG_02493 [Fundidesulfovibrio magnetotacticus]|uniref:Yip1 domain-containing protein n=1 Tax=Fundidesulfovibrio magnetotacticus TaxID=2730080 RepID=A0A6V8LXV5_9BACT|nr:YIP1 family protein [Fundidesulfovibrio magnetotacticus]GFK94646.1 hypothetical protein NNJEOMEG_02493 [Fundidesulfovibrio magnetotacticus]